MGTKITVEMSESEIEMLKRIADHYQIAASAALKKAIIITNQLINAEQTIQGDMVITTKQAIRDADRGSITGMEM